MRSTASDIATRRVGTIPLTYPAWEEKAKKVKHGSLNATQAYAKWEAWHDDKSIDRDHLGIVSGESGHLRLHCPLIEAKFSDSVRGTEKIHVTSSKTA